MNQCIKRQLRHFDYSLDISHEDYSNDISHGDYQQDISYDDIRLFTWHFTYVTLNYSCTNTNWNSIPTRIPTPPHMTNSCSVNLLLRYVRPCVCNDNICFSNIVHFVKTYKITVCTSFFSVFPFLCFVLYFWILQNHSMYVDREWFSFNNPSLSLIFEGKSSFIDVHARHFSQFPFVCFVLESKTQYVRR